jgi:DNA-directed RNA polymerase specialized sigma24 family protein
MKVGWSTGEDGRIVSPEAFEAAFRMHYVPVYQFIAGRVGPALAEDLAAETFATAYRRRASFEPGRGSLRAWLFGIAVNLVRNHWRAEQHLLQLDARLVPETNGCTEGADQGGGRSPSSRPAWTKRITPSTSLSSSAALGGAARAWASSLS